MARFVLADGDGLGDSVFEEFAEFAGGSASTMVLGDDFAARDGALSA